MKDLEEQLYKKLINAEEESKKLLGYQSNIFINMLNTNGAVETVKKLIKKRPLKCT